MGILVAAVVTALALCGLNLVFVLGVVRRLREYTKLLDALYELAEAGGLGGTAGNFPPVGERVGEFAATTVDGAPLSRETLADSTVAAFLSPDCESCREQLPTFVDWARGQHRERVLAVVNSVDPASRDMADRLREVATVVVEGSDHMPVAEAFRVRSWPGFCVLAADGEVRSVTAHASRLPVAVDA